MKLYHYLLGYLYLLGLILSVVFLNFLNSYNSYVSVIWTPYKLTTSVAKLFVISLILAGIWKLLSFLVCIPFKIINHKNQERQKKFLLNLLNQSALLTAGYPKLISQEELRKLEDEAEKFNLPLEEYIYFIAFCLTDSSNKEFYAQKILALTQQKEIRFFTEYRLAVSLTPNNPSLALKYALESIQTSPHNLEANKLVLDLYFKQKNWEKVELYLKSVEADIQNPHDYPELCRYYYELAQHKNKDTSISPDIILNYLERGILYSVELCQQFYDIVQLYCDVNTTKNTPLHNLAFLKRMFLQKPSLKLFRFYCSYLNKNFDKKEIFEDFQSLLNIEKNEHSIPILLSIATYLDLESEYLNIKDKYLTK